MAKGTKAEIATEKIIADLRNRRGLRHQWEAIDEDIQQEIRETWISIVEKVHREASPQTADRGINSTRMTQPHEASHE